MYLKNLVLALLVFAVVSMPILWFYWQNPNDFMARTNAVGILQTG